MTVIYLMGVPESVFTCYVTFLCFGFLLTFPASTGLPNVTRQIYLGVH